MGTVRKCSTVLEYIFQHSATFSYSAHYGRSAHTPYYKCTCITYESIYFNVTFNYGYY